MVVEFNRVCKWRPFFNSTNTLTFSSWAYLLPILLAISASGVAGVTAIRPVVSVYGPIVTLNGVMYMGADFGDGFGRELYMSDGTTPGTIIADDIRVGAESSYPTILGAFGGALYFTANSDGVAYDLYRTTGGFGNATLIKSAVSGSFSVSSLIEFNSHIYFKGNDAGGAGNEIWRTDGTPGGTALFADILPGPSSGGFSDPAVYDGWLYFGANDGNSGAGRGMELWRTDGAATARYADINPGGDSSGPTGMTVFAGELWFRADNGSVGGELASTDGSGTVTIEDLRPGSAFESSDPENFGIGPNGMFLSAFEQPGNRVWQITNAGATNQTDLNGLVNFGPFIPLIDRTIGFSSSGGVWSFVDESAAVETLDSGYLSQINDPTALGSIIAFVATRPGFGFELAGTDGSAAGTGILVDINAGSGSAMTSSTPLLLNNGGLYFFANPGGGQQLYRYDHQPGQIEFVESTIDVDEADTSVIVEFERNSGSDGPAAITVSTGGDADIPQDYTVTPSHSATWSTGDSATKSITVNIHDDDLAEGNEVILLTLYDAAGASVGPADTLIITILDDEPFGADLKTTVDNGQSFLPGGESTTYTIAVMNDGIEDAIDAVITTTSPSALSSLAWSCVATSGAVCPLDGVGDLNETVDLPQGEILTFMMDADVQLSPEVLVEFAVSATPAKGQSDINLMDNSASDSDQIGVYLNNFE